MKTRVTFFMILLSGLQICYSQNRMDSSQLFQRVKVLSSDSLEGRRTGTLGNEKARIYIIDQLRQIGVASFYPDYQQQFKYNLNERKESGVNIVGYLEGDSTLSIVLSAHYDHLGMNDSIIYNGADDNASGISTLLSIAKYFSEHKPRHTIIFAFFDGEEQGLKGSKAFVKSSLFDEKNTAININLDMIGRSENKLFAAGTHHYPYLKTYLGKHNSIEVSQGHDDSSFPKEDWTLLSDHLPFHELKIPFVYFGVEEHIDYHQPTDTYDKLNNTFYHLASEYILYTMLLLDEDLEFVHSHRQD